MHHLGIGRPIPAAIVGGLTTAAVVGGLTAAAVVGGLTAAAATRCWGCHHLVNGDSCRLPTATAAAAKSIDAPRAIPGQTLSGDRIAAEGDSTATRSSPEVPVTHRVHDALVDTGGCPLVEHRVHAARVGVRLVDVVPTLARVRTVTEAATTTECSAATTHAAVAAAEAAAEAAAAPCSATVGSASVGVSWIVVVIGGHVGFSWV